jgi:hypothetical protein
VDEGDIPEYQAEVTKTDATLSWGPRVALEIDGEAEDDTPRWQHVATEGEYRGYNYGEQPFSFTRATFEEVIKNFRADPAYHKGADGFGDADVIPWDYHHATDSYPADVAVHGAPAQGWVRELGIRVGDDGLTQLWALTRWLPEAKQYIKDGAYKWASVSLWLNAVDPHTGERIGALLTSIAITNNPFIPGLEQLAAERAGKRDRVGAMVDYWWDAANDPQDAANKMKAVLGLKETDDVSVLVSEIARMQQWLSMGTVPLGVDLDGITAAFRKILGLRALATTEEVLAEAASIAGALIADRAPTAQPGTEAPSATSTNELMEDDMDLLEQLSKALGVRKGDAEVVGAVQDAVELRASMKTATGANKDTNEAIHDEVVALAADRKGLVSLRKALGTEKQEDAIERITKLLEAEKTLLELQPKYDELQARVDAEDKAKAEAEVDEVIATRRLPEDVKDALLELRLNKPEVFQEKFPALGDRAALTQPGITEPGRQPVPTPKPGDAQVIDLSAYQGNQTARMKAWVRDNVTGADKWDEEQVWKRACMLRRTSEVVGL